MWISEEQRPVMLRRMRMSSGPAGQCLVFYMDEGHTWFWHGDHFHLDLKVGAFVDDHPGFAVSRDVVDF
jgi:hypothetical protein